MTWSRAGAPEIKDLWSPRFPGRTVNLYVANGSASNVPPGRWRRWIESLFRWPPAAVDLEFARDLTFALTENLYVNQPGANNADRYRF